MCVKHNLCIFTALSVTQNHRFSPVKRTKLDFRIHSIAPHLVKLIKSHLITDCRHCEESEGGFGQFITWDRAGQGSQCPESCPGTSCSQFCSHPSPGQMPALCKPLSQLAQPNPCSSSPSLAFGLQREGKQSQSKPGNCPRGCHCCLLFHLSEVLQRARIGKSSSCMEGKAKTLSHKP